MYIKSKRFCTESSFDSTLRKPKKTACGVTSNKVKSFSKNKASHSIILNYIPFVK